MLIENVCHIRRLANKVDFVVPKVDLNSFLAFFRQKTAR